MRVLIDLSADQIGDLALLCQSEKISRAELIRRAISHYLATQKTAPVNAFGLWRDKAVDGLAWQQQVRDEW
jgi:Ribbon-helix-helix protein, copG family